MSSTEHRIEAVLFDLDGTLVDTAPDLALALNTLLEEQGRTAAPYDAIRAEASYGGKALVTLGFGLPDTDPGFESLRQRFLELYRSNICQHSKLFDGMDTVLSELERTGRSWGVVTNKPSFLTDPLMQALKLDTRAGCIVSGDTTANSKPHPEPLLHACRLTGHDAPQCLYVGDAARDIEAGHQAGMQTLAAEFGYIRSDDDPQAWGADAVIQKPEDILDWLGQHG